MCMYCEEGMPKKYEFRGDRGIPTVMQSVTEWMGMFGKDSHDYDDNDAIQISGGKLYWDNSSHEYSSLGCKINYCPFCGVRLRCDKEDSNE